MKRSLRLLAAFALLTAAAVPSRAQAQSITYLFTGIGSGSLENAAFSDRQLTFSFTGNISNVLAPGGVFCGGSLTPANTSLIENLVSNFSIVGVSSGTLSGNAYAFSNRDTDRVGFGSCANNDLVNLDVDGNTYGMTTNFGPVNDAAPFFSQFTNQSTSEGALSITSLRNATFQATTGTVVPEPSTYLLMVTGLAFVGVAARRRRASN